MYLKIYFGIRCIACGLLELFAIMTNKIQFKILFHYGFSECAYSLHTKETLDELSIV